MLANVHAHCLGADRMKPPQVILPKSMHSGVELGFASQARDQRSLPGRRSSELLHVPTLISRYTRRYRSDQGNEGTALNSALSNQKLHQHPRIC
jgi:hypothetical protein